ncbi:MAG: hypothetical protein AAF234_08845 [Pseudomonadota bacterium]
MCALENHGLALRAKVRHRALPVHDERQASGASETVVDVTLADGNKLIAALAEDKIYTPGEQLHFTFLPDMTHLFPEDEEAAQAVKMPEAKKAV